MVLFRFYAINSFLITPPFQDLTHFSQNVKIIIQILLFTSGLTVFSMSHYMTSLNRFHLTLSSVNSNERGFLSMIKVDPCASVYDVLRNVCDCQQDVTCANDVDDGDDYYDGHRATQRAGFDYSNRDQSQHFTQFEIVNQFAIVS